MCKYDEAFTEQEMLEETGYCQICKLDCPNAGKVFEDKSMKMKSIQRWVLIIGWLICAMFAFIDLPKDLLAKMYFICCLVLCVGNVGELINGN